MNDTHYLEAEIEELERKYWLCFNNHECEEDLEKIQCNIERLQFLVTMELSKS